jgi:hypothetical protein
MGGVVLQGMVMLMPSKAKKQYLCALNVYYDRVRKNYGIRGHNPPFLSFFEFFFFTFPLKTPSEMTGKPTESPRSHANTTPSVDIDPSLIL